MTWKTQFNWRVLDFKKALIAITFDDFNASDYTVAFPIFTDRNIVGTSYVYGENMNANPEKWVNAKTMHDAGWEIACHSFTHRQMGTLTEAELQTEMQNQDAAFEANNLPTAKHHAFPYGNRSDLAIAVIAQYRLTGRTTSGSPRDYSQAEWLLRSLETDINSAEIMATVRTKINDAATNKQFLVPFAHSVVDALGTSTTIAREYLIEMIEYAKFKNMKFVTVDQLYNILERYNQYA